MKLSKKILSLMMVFILALSTIMTVQISAATFSDIPETEKYSNAVNVLSSLGIINGYEDGTFRPENNVTRAEFTAMLMRAKGLDKVGDTSLENPPFPDVTTPDVSWAIGNIRSAVGLGIIKGYEDGTFRPNNNVLLEEAVTMIVRMIGYENYSSEGNEWYTKYIITATKLGILDSVGAVVGTPAKRSHIAQLVHNTLDVKIADENGITDETLMGNELKLEKETGIICSNEVTSLQTPDISLKSGYINIRNEKTGIVSRFKYKDAAKFSNMLGYRVEYFYSYDRDTDENIISSMTAKNNNLVKINVVDIDSAASSSSQIKYYVDGTSRTNTVNIANDSIVIYNEKLYGSSDADSKFSDYYTAVSGTFPLVGSVSLLDNNGDNSYDVVFVEDYQIYAVTSVIGAPTYSVTDTLTRTSGNKIVLNPETDENIRFIDKNGSKLTFSSISVGNVICVKQSSGNGGTVLTTVVVCKDTISGQIKSVTSGKRVKINTGTYDYSYAAPWMYQPNPTSLQEPQMGDSGTFYLDFNGDIVAYKKTTTTSNQQYAYLIDAYINTQNMDRVLVAKLYTQKSGLLTVISDDDTKINGNTKVADDILLDLQTAENNQGQGVTTTNPTGVSQLVKISTKTVDGQTVIDEIITATPGANLSEIDETSLQMSSDFLAANKTAEYVSTRAALKNSTASANITSSWIISVPNNRSDEKGYKKVSINDVMTNGTSYNAEIYDITTSTTAKVVVLYDLSSTVAVGEVSAKTPTFVVTEIGQEENPSNGKTMYKILGYEANDAELKTYWGSISSNSVFKDVDAGDVVRFGTDSEGFYTLAEIDVLFSTRNIRNSVIANYVSGATLQGVTDDADRYYLTKRVDGTQYTAIWGYLEACDGSNLLIDDKKYTNVSSVDFDAQHSYALNKTGSTLFFNYTKSGSTWDISLLNGSDGFNASDYYRSLPQLGNNDEPTELFIFDRQGAPHIIITIVR